MLNGIEVSNSEKRESILRLRRHRSSFLTTTKNTKTINIIMKFAVLVAALSASSIDSAIAADANGYTGSDYTFVGVGLCLPALPVGSNIHYSYAATSAPIYPGSMRCTLSVV